MAAGDESENTRPGCKAGALRKLPLPNPAPDVERYAYTSTCGGVLDQATFHFYKNRLTKYYFYFNGEYFKGIGVNDFLGKMKELYGEPRYEKWLDQNIRGSITWINDKNKVALEFFSSMPFVLKIEEVKAAEATQSTEGATPNDNAKRLEGVVY